MKDKERTIVRFTPDNKHKELEGTVATYLVIGDIPCAIVEVKNRETFDVPVWKLINITK
jgi:hypothetical protein